MTSELLGKKGFKFLPDKDRTYYLKIADSSRIYGAFQAAGLADDASWGIRDNLIIQCDEDFSNGVLYDGVDLYHLGPDDFEELVLWL